MKELLGEKIDARLAEQLINDMVNRYAGVKHTKGNLMWNSFLESPTILNYSDFKRLRVPNDENLYFYLEQEKELYKASFFDVCLYIENLPSDMILDGYLFDDTLNWVIATTHEDRISLVWGLGQPQGIDYDFYRLVLSMELTEDGKKKDKTDYIYDLKQCEATLNSFNKDWGILLYNVTPSRIYLILKANADRGLSLPGIIGGYKVLLGESVFQHICDPNSIEIVLCRSIDSLTCYESICCDSVLEFGVLYKDEFIEFMKDKKIEFADKIKVDKGKSPLSPMFLFQSQNQSTEMNLFLPLPFKWSKSMK